MYYLVPILLCSFNVFAESLFYSPHAEEENAKSDYTINHKTSLGALIGKSHDKNDTPSTNAFQKGRLNMRSLVEVEDTKHKHKAVVDLRLGTDAMEDRGSMLYLQQGYIEMQNAESQPLRAKVSFGLQNTASNSLAVNSSTTMKNSQGIGGQWYRFVQMPVVNQSGGYNPTFILQNSSLIAQGFGDATFLHSTNNSGALNYVQPSPNWSTTNVGLGFTIQRTAGFKASFTYQPFGNSGNFNGTQGNGGYDRRGIAINRGSEMFMKDITSFAINYLNEWRGISLNTTLSAETANFERNSLFTPERNKIEQYTAGINLSYIGFTLGGSYSYSGQSLLLKQNMGQLNSYAVNNQNSITTLSQLYNIGNANLLAYKDSYNYDIGLSYAFSRYQIGIAYNKSRFMNNEANATVLSLSEDLKVINGIKLTTIFEGGFYRFNSASYFKENNGAVSVATPNQTHGYFGYIGVVASI